MRLNAERTVVLGAMAISLVVLGLQALVLRPHLWPAGAGLAVSGDTVMGVLAAPRPVSVIRPPDLADAAGQSVTVLRVQPGGPADQAGIHVGDTIRTLPTDAEGVLRIWRDAVRSHPAEPAQIGRAHV